MTRSSGPSDNCWPISRERKVPEIEKLVGCLPMPLTIIRTSFKVKGQMSKSPGGLLLRPKVYHIYRTGRLIRTSKLVRRWSMSYQLPLRTLEACEVGFLHVGGGIPCRPHPTATQLLNGNYWTKSLDRLVVETSSNVAPTTLYLATKTKVQQKFVIRLLLKQRSDLHSTVSLHSVSTRPSLLTPSHR